MWWALLFVVSLCAAFALGFLICAALSLNHEDQLKFPHP